MKIVYLAPEIPALSATFVYNEILILKDMGVDVLPVSIHRPKSPATDSHLTSLKQQTFYLYEQALLLALWKHVPLMLRHPVHYIQSAMKLLMDLSGQRFKPRQSAARLYQFLYAGLLAHYLSQHKAEHIHVHFAHVPTDIAMYTASFLGIGYSVTSHANDLFERASLIKQKVARSAFFATISKYNIDFLTACGVDTHKLKIIRCGVDDRQFTSVRSRTDTRIRHFGTVGRLVEKKGIDTLIEAFATVAQRYPDSRLSIAGDGPLRMELERQVSGLNISDKVHFLGALAHHQIPGFLTDLDTFVLPCKKDRNGDMDGIPVVLMEAMMNGLPVVSTRISGIPELVIDHQTGLLVSPDHPAELAAVLLHLIETPDIRETLTTSAITHIQSHFSLLINAGKLKQLFEDTVHDRYKDGK